MRFPVTRPSPDAPIRRLRRNPLRAVAAAACCVLFFGGAQVPGQPVPGQPAPATGAVAPRAGPTSDADGDVSPGPEPAPATAPAADGERVTTAAALRALTPAQAARRLPVRIRGSVTYASNYLASLPPVLFVQDETGGACAVGPRGLGGRGPLRAGAVIEVEGVTAPGRLVPYVVPRARNEPLSILVRDGVARVPPRSVPLADLAASPRSHGDLVEVQGVVRTVRTETVVGATAQVTALVVALTGGGGRAEAAFLPWNPALPTPTQWVGATLRARGVFNSATPEWQQPAGMRLLINARADLTIAAQATPAAALPVTPVASVGAAANDRPQPARAKLAGVVTLAHPGKGMYVQDDTGGVWVEAADPPGAAGAPAAGPGDVVEVLGFPARRPAGSAFVEDAGWQVTGRGGLPPAPRLTAEQALSGPYHARLVAIDALVLEVSRLAEGPTLVLQSGERVFLARLAEPTDPGRPPFGAVAESNWVRVTGVCVNNSRVPGTGGAVAADAVPVSFHLMLAAPAAVQLIRPPTWWTFEKALVATAVVLVATLASLAWVFALRRRVAEQTAQIRRHLNQHAVSEERVRIARDLHDSLEQDLLGITMQLKATEKLLDRPDRARESLTLASAMVRRSQAETHRAVWDLRERKAGQAGLVPTLRAAVAGLTAGAAYGAAAAAAAGGGPGADGGPAVAVRVDGAERDLSPQTENHLLRVALESVTNAFKHAAASRVDVTIGYEPRRVTLEVRDDGKGFDADHPPPPNSGHFGLFGMRERADKLHGDLTVTSGPGAGTVVRLVVPTGEGGNGRGSGAGPGAL